MTRLAKLREAMGKKECSAILLNSPASVRYIAGFTGSFGFAIITPNNAVFITDSRYTIQANKECPDFDVRSWGAPVDGMTFLLEQLQSLNITEIGYEPAGVTVAQLGNWRKKLKGIKFKPVDNILAPLRLVKDEGEIALTKDAVAIVDNLFNHIHRFIQVGAVEYDISLEIEFYIRRQGAEIGFPPIVVSGAQSALPHGKPSEKQLEYGDFVTMDYGAKFKGYNSDITRTVIVGKASPEHKRIYNAVLEAQLKALEVMKPGVKASDVDKTARDVLEKYDLNKYFGHGLGHSLGLTTHDGDSLSSASKAVLEPGQIWTVEPGVYIEGFGGVRIEDDVVVTQDGIEILTKSTKELLEFDR